MSGTSEPRDDAAAPPKRGRFQLRLSTLLLLMLIIGLACGWWVDHARLMRQVTSQGHEIRVFALQNVKADEVEKTLRDTFPLRFGDVNPINVASNAKTNSVIVRGSHDNLEVVQAILMRLDK